MFLLSVSGQGLMNAFLEEAWSSCATKASGAALTWEVCTCRCQAPSIFCPFR